MSRPSFDPSLDPSRPPFSDRLFDARYARPTPAGAALWGSPAPAPKPRRRDGPAPRSRRAAARAAGRKLRGAALLGVGLGGGAAALAGWGLVAALVLARTVAPPSAVVSRDLWVDYTASPAVATASFLPDGAAAASVGGGGGKGEGGGPSSAATSAPPVRAFAAGRRVDVWLTLAAPDAPPSAAPGAPPSSDVVQVRAELLAGDGRVLASASRPAFLPYRSRAVRALRALLRAPLVVAGLADEMQAMRLPLFNGFRDAAAAPAVGLRVALAGRPSPRAGGAPADTPPLHSLRAHARQRLGWVVGALYLVRPGDSLAFVLYCVAALAIAAGTAAAALAVAVALMGDRGDAGLGGWLPSPLRRAVGVGGGARGGADGEPPSPGPSADGSGASYDLSPSSASASATASVGSDDGGGDVGEEEEEEGEADGDDEWRPIAAARVAAPHPAPPSPPPPPPVDPASLDSPPLGPPLGRTLSGARTVAPAEGGALADRAAAETLRRRRGAGSGGE